MQVAEGIERVEGTRIGNAYLVEVDGGLLVVDTGFTGNAGRIVAAIERLGRRPADVRHIVLTHWHPDHMGSAAALRRRTGAPIAIHERDASILAGGERPARGRRAMGFLFRVFGIAPVEPDVILQAGEAIDGLGVIHVPGHTAGSIALRRIDGVILSGDALLGDRRGRQRPPDPGLSLDPDQAAASASTLRSLDPWLLLPGHGAPVHR